MEVDVRRILQSILGPSPKAPSRNLYDRIHSRFALPGGVDLELPPRDAAGDPPRFD